MAFPMQVPGDSPHYFESGIWSVSAPNLIVILLMILLFVLALVLPFPKDHDDSSDAGESS
jgi:hypothetical protein